MGPVPLLPIAMSRSILAALNPGWRSATARSASGRRSASLGCTNLRRPRATLLGSQSTGNVLNKLPGSAKESQAAPARHLGWPNQEGCRGEVEGTTSSWQPTWPKYDKAAACRPRTATSCRRSRFPAERWMACTQTNPIVERSPIGGRGDPRARKRAGAVDAGQDGPHRSRYARSSAVRRDGGSNVVDGERISIIHAPQHDRDAAWSRYPAFDIARARRRLEIAASAQQPAGVGTPPGCPARWSFVQQVRQIVQGAEDDPSARPGWQSPRAATDAGLVDIQPGKHPHGRTAGAA